VEVSVVEAGHNRSAKRIDRDRLRPLHPQDLAVAAHLQDLVGPHRNRFRHLARVAGEHDGVVHDQIDRTVVVVTLGADDQAGNQGHRNDADDSERGETGGHQGRILACTTCYSPPKRCRRRRSRQLPPTKGSCGRSASAPPS
jgi:hypothetical protein